MKTTYQLCYRVKGKEWEVYGTIGEESVANRALDVLKGCRTPEGDLIEFKLVRVVDSGPPLVSDPSLN